MIDNCYLYASHTNLEFLSNTGPKTLKKLLLEDSLTDGIELSKSGSMLSYALRHSRLLKMSFALVIHVK